MAVLRVIYPVACKVQVEKIAEELGRSRQWVGDRLSLALRICDDAQKTLAAGGITLKQALIISQIENNQERFLSILLREQEARKHR
jgi:hypothetical protein